MRAFLQVVRYRRNQQMLMQTPASIAAGFSPDTAAAQRVLQQALADGRGMLTEPEAKQVLAAYGIPVVATRVAASVAEAGRIAAELGFPVALKILSPDITHKSDVGGVVLDLETPEQVRSAAEAMLRRLAQAQPQAPPGRLFGAADGAPAAGLRADRRRRQRPGVRAGDPVRPGRHRGRGDRRPRAGAAAAEPQPGARTGGAHADRAPAGRLPQPAGDRPRSAVRGAGAHFAIAVRFAASGRTGHQPAVRRRARRDGAGRPHPRRRRQRGGRTCRQRAAGDPALSARAGRNGRVEGQAAAAAPDPARGRAAAQPFLRCAVRRRRAFPLLFDAAPAGAQRNWRA